MTRGRVVVFVGCSLDGFIAGDDDDLSWLPAPVEGGSDNGFGALLERVGALLMGRRTFDVAAGLPGPWPYGARPVLVATHRQLLATHAAIATARAVNGDITSMVDAAHDAAAGRDVYVDGGVLIRAALDAGLVDLVTLTLVPRILGRGHALFAGAARRHGLTLLSNTTCEGGLVQLTYRVDR